MAYTSSHSNGVYELIGGEQTIRRLVEAFYTRVYQHPDLIPLFDNGVEEIKKKQYLFLTQFSGGPALYTERFGFGNMRAIHEQFPITPTRAAAWLQCMKGAMDEIGLEGIGRERLFMALTNAAYRFVNLPDQGEHQREDGSD